jgi:hypothetical protein
VCSGYFNRGTCSSKLYIRQDELEERLLGKLRTELLQPEVVDLAIESFGRQLRSSLASVSNELTEMQSRKERLEREIRNFTHAIAENGHSKYILEEIVVREKEISRITDRLLSSIRNSIQSQIEEVRRLVQDGIQNLQQIFSEESPAARYLSATKTCGNPRERKRFEGYPHRVYAHGIFETTTSTGSPLGFVRN